MARSSSGLRLTTTTPRGATLGWSITNGDEQSEAALNTDDEVTGFLTDGFAVEYEWNGTRPSEVKGPGFERSVTYNDADLLWSQTDNGLTTSFAYDTRERLSSITSQGAKTEFEYNPGPKVSKRSVRRTLDQAIVHEEIYTYDTAARLDTLTSDAVIRSFDWFADGQLRTMKVFGWTARHFERDTAGRITKAHIDGVTHTYTNFDTTNHLPKTESVRFGNGPTVAVNYEFKPPAARQEGD